MPIHQYEHPETGKTIDVYVPANASTTEHSLQIVEGQVYKRVYSAPLVAQNLGTRHGDATAADFQRCTGGKRGFKLGDAWEVSAEMSAKRADRNGGLDPVAEDRYARHEKETGEKHEDVVRREKLSKANSKLAEWGIKINL